MGVVEVYLRDGAVLRGDFAAVRDAEGRLLALASRGGVAAYNGDAGAVVFGEGFRVVAPVGSVLYWVERREPERPEPRTAEEAWAGHDDVEILPFDPAALERPLRDQSSWTHRSLRTVLMDLGNGRTALLWAKGAAIPDEEARRQGLVG